MEGKENSEILSQILAELIKMNDQLSTLQIANEAEKSQMKVQSESIQNTLNSLKELQQENNDDVSFTAFYHKLSMIMPIIGASIFIFVLILVLILGR